MHLLGVNHTTAALDLRERLAINPGRLAAALRRARRLDAVDEALVLSTCNRVEVYCAPAPAREATAFAALAGWLSAESGVASDALRPRCYAREGDAAVAHAIRVASGLDSMALGEPQIFGQMKAALAVARGEGAAGAALATAFGYVFRVAKRVRADTALGAQPVSIASIAIGVARRLFDDIARCKTLLVGAGDTARLVSRHLADAGVRDMAIANRTPERAAALAAETAAEIAPLSALPERLVWADIVFCATNSPAPLIDLDAARAAARRRVGRPLLIVDLAVPSDVATGVNALSDIYLYDLDALRKDADRNREERQDAVWQAEAVVRRGVAEYRLLKAGRGADGLIERYRRRAERIRDAELRAAERALRRGVSAERALGTLATRLTQQLTHEPSVQFRRAARERRDDVLNWAKEWLEGEGS